MTKTTFNLDSPATSNNQYFILVRFYYSFCGETYCFCPVRLKLLNRISWNLVGSKYTICSCAYYQEMLISWIMWELCPFELRNFPKFTTEAACRRNSSETTEQNLRTPYVVVHITRKCWSPKFCGSFAPLNLTFSEIYFWSSLSAQLLWNYWTEFHETW